MTVEQGLLQSTREYLGIGLEEAAREIGISPDVLSAFEGPGGDPDELRLRRIAAAYGLRVDFFESTATGTHGDDLVALGRLRGELSGPDLVEAARFAQLLRFAEL